jgi:hypothetical protein
MSNDENSEISSNHNRYGCIWGISVLIVLAVVLCAWTFHTKSISLSATPGETAMIEVPVFYVQESAQYGTEAIQISGDPINPEDYSVHRYTCKNGKITGRRTEEHSTSFQFQAYLTNNCDADVKIDIWWYDGFGLMNSFF